MIEPFDVDEWRALPGQAIAAYHRAWLDTADSDEAAALLASYSLVMPRILGLLTHAYRMSRLPLPYPTLALEVRYENALRSDPEGWVTPEELAIATRPPRIQLMPLRRLIRTFMLNRPGSALRAQVDPRRVVVSVNPALSGAARADGHGLAFDHAPILLQRLRAKNEGSLPAADSKSRLPTIRRLCDQMVEAARQGGINEDLENPLASAVSHVAEIALDRAAADLHCARRWARRLLELWSGSAGHYYARVLGLAAMAEGAECRRFAHTPGFGPLGTDEQLLQLETAASTRFDHLSMSLADLLRQRTKDRTGACQVSASTLPHRLSAETALVAGPPAGDANRVAVLFSGLVWSRVSSPSTLPASMLVEWQKWLVQLVTKIDRDSRFFLHPECDLPKHKHPLNVLPASEPENFEAVMGKFSVFLFDHPSSSTFWTALQTTGTVVLLDFGYFHFPEPVDRLIRERCQFVEGWIGEDGRMRVDENALEAAIANATPADPTALRRFFGKDDR